jgi:hypothetical protein
MVRFQMDSHSLLVCNPSKRKLKKKKSYSNDFNNEPWALEWKQNGVIKLTILTTEPCLKPSWD